MRLECAAPTLTGSCCAPHARLESIDGLSQLLPVIYHLGDILRHPLSGFTHSRPNRGPTVCRVSCRLRRLATRRHRGSPYERVAGPQRLISRGRPPSRGARRCALRRAGRQPPRTALAPLAAARSVGASRTSASAAAAPVQQQAPMRSLTGLNGAGGGAASPHRRAARRPSRETLEACAIIFAAAYLSGLLGFNFGASLGLHGHLRSPTADVLGEGPGCAAASPQQQLAICSNARVAAAMEVTILSRNTRCRRTPRHAPRRSQHSGAAGGDSHPRGSAERGPGGASEHKQRGCLPYRGAR